MSIEQKLNFSRNLNTFADKKVETALQVSGKILPVSVVSQSGKMVTVSFDLHETPFLLESPRV